MVSKREKRKREKQWYRFLREHEDAMGLRATALFIEQMLFEQKMRRKTLRMASKRNLKDYVR